MNSLFKDILFSKQRLNRQNRHPFLVLRLISQLPSCWQMKFWPSRALRLKKPLQPSQVIAPKCKPEEASPHTVHFISLKEISFHWVFFSRSNDFTAISLFESFFIWSAQNQVTIWIHSNLKAFIEATFGAVGSSWLGYDTVLIWSDTHELFVFALTITNEKLFTSLTSDCAKVPARRIDLPAHRTWIRSLL